MIFRPCESPFGMLEVNLLIKPHLIRILKKYAPCHGATTFHSPRAFDDATDLKLLTAGDFIII